MADPARNHTFVHTKWQSMVADAGLVVEPGGLAFRLSGTSGDAYAQFPAVEGVSWASFSLSP